MTNYSQTSNPETFPSFASLRAAHSELLKQHRQTELTPKLLTEVKTFLLRGRTTGALLDTEDERWAAQSLLDYWTSILYRQGEEPPDTTLVEFDPSLAPELPDSLCPYLGLKAFREENHNLFYGRQRLLNKLLKRLQENRFLAVIGSSGSGKSSIVLAGLLPSLKAGKLSESDTWHYYSPMVPGSQPLNNLASVLCPAEQEMNTWVWVNQQIEEFKANPNHLLTLLNERGSQPGVLVIDQFEETFTLCLDNQIRQAFINNLLRVIQSSESSHVVILTMRTDFESRVALYSEFQQEFENVQVRVISMDARELREAIEKPAELIGLKFEENLTNRLLEDVLGEPTALPLLQFTLLKLWENRERNRVTWESYKRLGGVRSVLVDWAEQLYEQLIPEDRIVARLIFMRMIRVTEDSEIIRCRIGRQTLYELGEAKDHNKRVLDKFIQGRLVQATAGRQTDDAQVEIIYEALVQNWSRLVEWIEAEWVNLRNIGRLQSAVQQWLELDKDPSVLWRGALLQEVLSQGVLRQEAENYNNFLSKLEQEFVTSSLESSRPSRPSVLPMPAPSSVPSAVWSLPLQKKLQNNKSYIILLWVMIMTGSFYLINLITFSPIFTRFDKSPPSTSTYYKSPLPPLADKSPPLNFLTYKSPLTSTAFSPDKNLIATATDDGKVKLWKGDGTLVATLKGEQGLVKDVTFSLDGNLIATSSIDRMVNLWNTYNGKLIATLNEHQDLVTDVTFSPDGNLIATSSAKIVKLWKIDGTLVATLNEHQDLVTDVTFSPDGKLIATATGDGTVKLWKIDGTAVATLKGNQDRVTDGTVKLWELNDSLVSSIPTSQGSLISVAFSSDGKTIVTTSQDEVTRIWNLQDELVK